MESKEIYIKVTKNGPYLVYGNSQISEKVIVADENGVCLNYSDGRVFELKSEPTALCRCGKTKNAPFCDNSHGVCAFDGTETVPFKSVLEDANTYEGANIILKDNEKYCALARFCDANGSIWNLIYDGTEESDNEVKRQAALCPSGRLVLFDKKGNLIEEEFPKSIAVLEDEGLEISGPLWIRGGIRIESENGQSYEVRNRQTICRCGNSANKPFCDCTHKYIKFQAKKQEKFET